MHHDETSDYLAINRLQAAYADTVTRRAWDELAGLFRPECAIAIDLRDGTTRDFVGGAAIGGFIATAIESFDFFEFAILNSVVDTSRSWEGFATGRVYVTEIRRDRATGAFSQTFGFYRDDYASDGGRWQFAARRYASLARHTDAGGTTVAFDLPAD